MLSATVRSLVKEGFTPGGRADDKHIRQPRSVIRSTVSIVTMSKIEKDEVKGLAQAIESGVGFAGYHGGAGDSFRECVEHQFIVGGCGLSVSRHIIDLHRQRRWHARTILWRI